MQLLVYYQSYHLRIGCWIFLEIMRLNNASVFSDKLKIVRIVDK